MKTAEYRDLTDHVFSMASDLSACVNDDERSKWVVRAERVRLEAWAATCDRASADDKAKMERARKALTAAFDSVVHLVFGDRKILGM